MTTKPLEGGIRACYMSFYFCSLLSNTLLKVENILKVAWIWYFHLHLQWKLKVSAGKFAWCVNAKHCWALSTTAMFCFIISNKLSRQLKVMELNPGYLPKSFLLYIYARFITNFDFHILVTVTKNLPSIIIKKISILRVYEKKNRLRLTLLNSFI